MRFSILIVSFLLILIALTETGRANLGNTPIYFFISILVVFDSVDRICRTNIFTTSRVLKEVRDYVHKSR